MKPDWKDAPDWAQWLAMDSNGLWYWHKNDPSIGEYCFISNRYQITADMPYPGFGVSVYVHGWKEAKEPRPKNETP